MAEKKKARTAKAPKPRAAKSNATNRGTGKKIAVKAASPAPRPKRKPVRAAPRQPQRFARKSATLNIADLLDHPLVTDLLAVGAIAAVAAIAEHRVDSRGGRVEKGSGKAVKAAGKAAAAAIGKRLMTEVDEIKKSAEKRQAKRGSK